MYDAAAMSPENASWIQICPLGTFVYLGEAVGKETEADRQITRQAAALDAIREVADHLGRAPGEALTTGEFNDGARGDRLGVEQQPRRPGLGELAPGDERLPR
jgi:hypothetical protein